MVSTAEKLGKEAMRAALLSHAALLFLMPALGATGCQSTRAASDQSVDELIKTPHFHMTIVGRCLKGDERKRALTEAHESKVRLLELIGPYIRPGDFQERKPKVLASPPESYSSTFQLPSLAAINIRVVDRPGRSFPGHHGIEGAKHYLSRHDLTHELVHYLAGASWAPVDEGLACYLTERLRGPDKKASLHLRVLVYIDLNMLKSLDPRLLEKNMTRVDYDASGSFVQFLIERYGWARFFQLYHGPTRNYHWVYGKAEHELIYQWRKSLDELNLRRSGDFYRFRAKLINGMKKQKKQGP